MDRRSFACGCGQEFTETVPRYWLGVVNNGELDDLDAAQNFDDLKDALECTPTALPFNEAARVRFGKIISDAVLPSRLRAPVRRVGRKGPP